MKIVDILLYLLTVPTRLPVYMSFLSLSSTLAGVQYISDCYIYTWISLQITNLVYKGNSKIAGYLTAKLTPTKKFVTLR